MNAISRNRFASLLLAAGALVSTNAAAIEWPADPSIARVRAWIEAFNASKHELLRDYVAMSYVPELLEKQSAQQIAAQYLVAKETIGELRAESVTREGDRIVVTSKGSNLPQPLYIIAKVQDGPPHLITGLAVSSRK